MRAASDEFDLDLERKGSVLVAHRSVAGDPRRLLLTIAGLAEKAQLAVCLPTDTGDAIVAWQAPDLILIRPTSFGLMGAWYVLRGFGPSAYHDLAELPKARATWSSPDDAPHEVARILETLGVNPKPTD